MALEHAKINALAVPTTPIGAPAIGEETTSVNGENHPTRALLLRLNRPANLAGVPAISIPCGLTSDGLPVGLQFISAVGDELRLTQVVSAFEELLPVLPRPPLFV